MNNEINNINITNIANIISNNYQLSIINSYLILSRSIYTCVT